MKTSDFVLIVFIYLMSSFLFLGQQNEGSLNIEFWDVGQGDSIYIETPHGKKILIDGGDNFESDFKLSKKMPFYSCKIDILILTHPHYDHLNGLNRVIQRCKIGTIMFNDVDFASRDFSRFKENVSKFDVKNILKGDYFEIDNIHFEILWPSKEFLQNGTADINDTSVVVLLDYGNFEALFTGDATSNVLGQLDLKYISKFIDGGVEVVKIPHHGSKYSLDKAFYSSLKPVNCVISVGVRNKFGHPSVDVVQYLESVCRVFRTDLDGDVEIKIK